MIGVRPAAQPPAPIPVAGNTWCDRISKFALPVLAALASFVFLPINTAFTVSGLALLLGCIWIFKDSCANIPSRTWDAATSVFSRRVDHSPSSFDPHPSIPQPVNLRGMTAQRTGAREETFQSDQHRSIPHPVSLREMTAQRTGAREETFQSDQHRSIPQPVNLRGMTAQIPGEREPTFHS